MTVTALPTPTPGWHRNANCAGLADLMFPGKGDLAGEAYAKRVCRGCPVNGECLAESIKDRDFEGVRAGFNGKERVRIADGAKPQKCERCAGWFVLQWPGQVRCRSCSRRAAGRAVES